jgi:alpha-tubulin suppressor-like RCC1 family protein
VAWGENENGELGVESPEKCEAEIACSKTPVEVPGLRKVEAIRSGGHTNYALVKETEKEPNKVMAWGFNADGELGNETTIDSTTPEPVKVRNGSGTLEPLTNVSAITSDSLTAFALKEGNVLAWGQNERGSLGYGATEGPEKCEEAIGLRVSCSTLPLPVKGLPGGEVTAISAGAGGYSGAALLKNKTVMDWGYNDWGELGDNESVIDEDKEASKGEAVHVCAAGVTVPKCPHGPYLGNVASIGSASYTNEALLSSGRLMMWGNGERGELGNGKKGNEKERNYSELPVEVPALREVAAIFHTPLSVLVLKNTQRPPRFYLNEALAVAKLESTLGAGEVTLENKVLGTIKCRVLDNGTVDNQTERGQAAIDAFLASPCTSAQHPSCPGIFATAEKPLESASEKTEPVRGALTTPWSGEAYNIAESETSEFRRLEAAHVGITVVVPPCEARLGMEVFFEGTLVPRIVNGTKNGLSPSHLVFDPGTAGLLYGTVLPETENTLTVSGNVKLAGETAFELIQAK